MELIELEFQGVIIKWVEGQHFYLKIKDINNYKDYYPYPSDIEPPNFTFILNIKHAPTISNFSHFEVQISIYKAKNEETSNISPKSQKLIRHKVKALIIREATF